MEQHEIINYINKVEKEKATHDLIWVYLEKLNKEVGFSDTTYKELQAKISSKIAQCDRSIRDHTKLL